LEKETIKKTLKIMYAPRGVEQMVTRCSIKALYGVEVTNSKLRRKKSKHAKGWCGSGWVKSLGDFDGLDVPISRLLKPHVSHVVISGIT